MIHKEKIDWIIKQHYDTNHYYDGYLPYEYHLRMVIGVFNRFKNVLVCLLDSDAEDFVDEDDTLKIVELSCWGHDLIEDVRVSYSDVSNVLGVDVVNIIYALTNEKGKTRKERANDKYYKLIRDTKYAIFVKLCDRIANVEYSKLSNSKTFIIYKNENKDFVYNLGYDCTKSNVYNIMFEYLINLFNM